jgi:hypothetical protein
MHFADVTLFYVAHPHQAILQWASEWGLPSLFLVMLLLARPAIAILRTTHAKRTSTTYENALRICLLAALIGAAADAMVDGVIVMPYTQTWVAIMAGWIWSLQPPAPSDSPARKHWSRRLTILSLAVILPAAGLLVHVTLRDYRQLEIMNHPDAPMRPGKGADPPRFWEHGSIAEPTAKSSARIKTSSGKNPYSKQESS